jgi:hypothetical protein
MIRLFNKMTRRLRRDEKGIAFIEFAYALPFFAGAGMVGLEFTNVVLAHQKTERIASTLADQIAANQIPPNERQIGDMFEAVGLIADPFEFTSEGNVVITAVIGIYDEDDDEVQNKIAWQRCAFDDSFESAYGTQWTDTNDIADGPEIELPDDIQLGQNQMAILSEVFFPYEELISGRIAHTFLPDDRTFRENALFRTRGQAIMNITPVTGVSEHTC